MDWRTAVRREKRVAVILVAAMGACLPAVLAAAGDLTSTLCNNQVVSVGDRKGEVLAKCGKPLSKSQDSGSARDAYINGKKKAGRKKGDGEKTVVTRRKIKEKEETWTYNIDGSYRFFIFQEGKLSRIETGRLAP